MENWNDIKLLVYKLDDETMSQQEDVLRTLIGVIQE